MEPTIVLNIPGAVTINQVPEDVRAQLATIAAFIHAITVDDPAAIDRITAQLKRNRETLAAAVAANAPPKEG